MVQKFNEPIMVTEIQDRLGNIIDLADIASNSADLIAAEADVATLQTEMSTAQTDITNLEAAPGTAVVGSAAESVATIEQQKVQKVTLTLTALVMNITAVLDYGSVAFADLPDSNLLFLGCEADIVVTKGNASTGIEAAVDLDMAIGTVAASQVTLVSVLENILKKIDIDADTLTPDFNGHSSEATTMPLLIQDGATNKLFINCGLPVGITVDDTLTMTGTVTIFYIELGNVTS